MKGIVMCSCVCCSYNRDGSCVRTAPCSPSIELQLSAALTREEAFKIAFSKLKENDLMCGKYDAKHGSAEYMLGIQAVMSQIAYEAKDYDFDEWFFDNLRDSQRNAAEGNKNV